MWKRDGGQSFNSPVALTPPTAVGFRDFSIPN